MCLRGNIPSSSRLNTLPQSLPLYRLHLTASKYFAPFLICFLTFNIAKTSLRYIAHNALEQLCHIFVFQKKHAVFNPILKWLCIAFASPLQSSLLQTIYFFANFDKMLKTIYSTPNPFIPFSRFAHFLARLLFIQRKALFIFLNITRL